MILLFLLLLGRWIEVTAGSGLNCDDNNGGCAQYCIDRNDGNGGFCSCACYYQLAPDGLGCNAIQECDVDMFWAFDFTAGVLSFFDCFNVKIKPEQSYPAFETWRDTTADYFQAFASPIDTGLYYVATGVWGGNDVEITNNYGNTKNASVLAAEIKSIVPPNICSEQKIFRGLYKISIQDNTVNYLPTGFRDRTTTTSVAVVNMAVPLSNPQETTLSLYSANMHDWYDNIFVIGRKDVSQLSGSDQSNIDHQLRWMACQNGDIVNCINLFYADSDNDNGISFTHSTVPGMIDRTACIKRKPQREFTASCNSATNVGIITVPLCLLGGLNASDLQFNNQACIAAAYSTTSGSDLIFTIPLADCLWSETSAIVNGVEQVTFTQSLTKKSGITGNAVNVSFFVTCTYPRYTNEQLGVFNPVVESVSQNWTSSGTFDISFIAYNDSTYTHQLTFPTTSSVLARLYFSAVADLPGESLQLIVTNVVATTTPDSNSSPRYVIMENQCVQDTTFRFENSVSDEIKKFSLQVFEFARTANEENGNKDPVYISITVLVCEDSDNSASCTQACPSRKKRKTGNDKMIHEQTHHVGPFYLDAKVDTADDNSTSNAESIDLIESKPVEYNIVFVSSYLEKGCAWIFMIVIATAVLTTICKCVTGKATKRDSDFAKDFPPSTATT